MKDLRKKIYSHLRLQNPICREVLGEILGTFILVFLGDGVLAQTTFGDHGRYKHGDFLVVSLGWGLAVMMGVFLASRTGGGVINPAVCFGFFVGGRLSPLRLLIYPLAETFGGFLGAAGVFAIYQEQITEVGKAFNTSGHVFSTRPSVSHGAAFADQVAGTALLAGGALAIIDRRGLDAPGWSHAPLLALLVTAIVGSFGLNAGAALNPARDLGPRIFLAAAGWPDAFSNSNYYFWVPIIGPIVGAVIGVIIFELFIGIQAVLSAEEEAEQKRAAAQEEDIELNAAITQ